jgi:hypothetical protein
MPELWTVGHYAYGQRWIVESDHDSPGKAADRVSYLNGERKSASVLEKMAELLNAGVFVNIEADPGRWNTGWVLTIEGPITRLRIETDDALEVRSELLNYGAGHVEPIKDSP